MHRHRIALLLALMVGAPALPASLARAADAPYPSKPIRLVVTLAPGGPLDLFARLIGKGLQSRLGQPVVVENKPGAASRIAIEAVLQAPPDGYSLLAAGGSITTLPVFVKGLNFDVMRDLTPVTIAADAQQIVLINGTLPAKTLAEFVAYAKANPRKANYGSLGKTPIMLAVEAFQRMAGIQMTEVPYKSSAELLTALSRNDVQFVLTAYELAAPQIASGAARALAAVGNLRLKAAPGLPALSELGYGGVRLPGWYAIVTRAGTPKAVIDALYAEIAKDLQQPDTVSKIEAMGSRVIALTPEQSRERMAAEAQYWTAIAREVNLQPE